MSVLFHRGHRDSLSQSDRRHDREGLNRSFDRPPVK